MTTIGGTADADYRLRRDVWEAAAATLVAEEGMEAAFDRLSGVPVPMPEAIHQALDIMSTDQRRAFVRRFVRKPTSALGMAHNLRALAWLGAHDPRYLRLGRRLARRLADPVFQAHLALLRLVASAAHASLRPNLSNPGAKIEAPVAAAGRSSADAPKETPEAPTTGTDHSSEDTAENAAAGAGARLVASWYHAHRVVSAFAATGGDPSLLIAELSGRDDHSTGDLFDPQSRTLRDLADARSQRPARFAAGLLQYASQGTALLDGADALLAELGRLFLQDGADEPFPHFDLLCDLSGHPDVLATFLQPTRGVDGTIAIASFVVVGADNVPDVLRASALELIERDPTVSAPWFALEVVTGGAALADPDAARLWEAVAGRDLAALLLALGPKAHVASARLARLALQLRGTQADERIREALITLGREQQRTGPLATKNMSGPRARSGAGVRELTDLQGAVVEALYILAQTGASPAESMRNFARDLTAVGRADAPYLRALRGTLERLVRARPLSEAVACVPLLLAARGS
jgi:hypothetical protein